MAPVTYMYVFLTVSTTLLFVWFWHLRTHEERTLRLGLAFACAVFSALALVELALVGADTPITRNIAIFIAALGVMVILLFPFVLVITLMASGVRLIRREGARPTNLLSLGLGILLVAYVAIWPWLRARLVGIPVMGTVLDLIFGLAAVALTVATVAFTLYTVTSLLVQVPHKKRRYRWIVVLGSGLLPDGNVTPLLAHRVEAGVAAWRHNPDSKLVMSGGQGPDEARPESAAMRDHALTLGVPTEAVLTEEKSTSTEENIAFSARLIASHDSLNPNSSIVGASSTITSGHDADQGDFGSHGAGGHVLVVSDDYHVLRALLLARRQGFPCDGRGSRVRLYFSLNALVREWVAYAVLRKRKYLRVLAVLWVLCAILWVIGVATGSA